MTSVPTVPDNQSNHAQPWSYSNERDTFGTFRGEWDITPDVTAWAAAGARRSEEANSLANITVNNGSTGAATAYRFDNTREGQRQHRRAGRARQAADRQRGARMGGQASLFDFDKKNAYAMDWRNTLATNRMALCPPTCQRSAALRCTAVTWPNPLRTGTTRLTSFAVGDTLTLLDKRLLLTAGVRHQKIDIGNYAYGTAALTSRYEQKPHQPLLAAVVKLDKSVSLYANYVEGLSQGQTAPAPPPTGGEMPSPTSPSKGSGREIRRGPRGRQPGLLQHRQAPAFLNSSNLFGTYGKDRHQGLELAVQGEATRACACWAA